MSCSENPRRPSADAYADIIHLPHPVSRKHSLMSMESRAAQFVPFAALSGHEEAIKRAARKNGAGA